MRPAVPVGLRHAVLDGQDRVAIRERGQVVGELRGGELAALRFELVGAVLVELGARDVEAEPDVVARVVARLLDRLEDHAERRLVRRQVRGEAALVADGGRELALVQDLLQAMEDLGAATQRLAVARQARRHDHEFLDVEAVVGVCAAVDDVHHRHRQHDGVVAAEMAEQRKPLAARPRRARSRARRRGSHSRRGATCSRCRRPRACARSMPAWSAGSRPTSESRSTPFTCCTACSTPLPR